MVTWICPISLPCIRQTANKWDCNGHHTNHNSLLCKIILMTWQIHFQDSFLKLCHNTCNFLHFSQCNNSLIQQLLLFHSFLNQCLNTCSILHFSKQYNSLIQQLLLFHKIPEINLIHLIQQILQIQWIHVTHAQLAMEANEWCIPFHEATIFIECIPFHEVTICSFHRLKSISTFIGM